jgi:hypothetical protein
MMYFLFRLVSKGRRFITTASQLSFRVRYEEVQEKQGLDLSGIHQLLVCADINLLSKNINIIKKHRSSIRYW